MSHIRYRKGYKYQLWETYSVQTPIVTNRIVNSRFIRLDNKGLLTIRAGYAWDGPSGPTFDTPDSMRPSLIDDAFHQLMREGLLDLSWRQKVCEFFRENCLKDGMDPNRAEIWYTGLSRLGGFAADPKNDRPVLVAPMKETI